MKISALQAIAITAASVAAAYIVYQVGKNGKTVAKAAGELIDKVNPANPDNVVAQVANKTVEAASGGRFMSVGDLAYHVFNKDDSGAIATAPTLTARPGQGTALTGAQALAAADDMQNWDGAGNARPVPSSSQSVTAIAPWLTVDPDNIGTWGIP